MSEDAARIAGVVLAGGAGRRLGGDKPLQLLLGKALIEHVIERVLPQVGRLWISARGTDPNLSSLGLPIVEDDSTREAGGPLAGIVAGIEAAAASGFDTVAVVPCDVPYIPADLVTNLERRLSQSNAPGVVVLSGGRLQPTIGLWRSTARASLRSALLAGRRKLNLVCGEVGAAAFDCDKIDWPVHAFLNVNTVFDMALAEVQGLRFAAGTNGSPPQLRKST